MSKKIKPFIKNIASPPVPLNLQKQRMVLYLTHLIHGAKKEVTLFFIFLSDYFYF